MEINFNKTGQERKDLVYAIGEIIGVAPVYTGAGGIHGMRFAYTVMNIIIDQNGTVIWDERTDDAMVTKLLDGLQTKGYEFERPADEKPQRKGILDTLVDALNENAEDGAKWERLHHEPTIIDGSGREHSLDGRFAATAEIPEDWENGMTEEEELGLSRTRREDFQGENGMRADDVPEADTLTVEYPLDGFNPETLDNLIKMVKAKEALIKAALGTDELPIQQSDEDSGKLLFPWFTLSDPSHAAYYVQFIFALCKAAKEKKRVTAKEKDVENPKYAMRCWLLSIGFIGNEYKAARKVLLSNLTGNSSWKNGKPEEAQNEVTE